MVARHGLGGGLAVPCALALCTASWVWVLPETRGIALPKLREGYQPMDEQGQGDSEDPWLTRYN